MDGRGVRVGRRCFCCCTVVACCHLPYSRLRSGLTGGAQFDPTLVGVTPVKKEGLSVCALFDVFAAAR